MMHEKDFCDNLDNLEMRLSKDFIEYSRSGNIFDRNSVIEGLLGLKEDRNIQITQFQLTLLSENVALVNYVSFHNHERTLRTSIWKNEDGNWRMRFHYNAF